MKSNIENIAIVGLGLLGSSLAASIRLHSDVKIIGVSSESAIEKALEANVIDEGYGRDQLDKWVSKVQLIFICTPISHIKSFIREIATTPTSNQVILTDVGSTKNEICKLAKEVLPPHIKFIGGHPMAGSEKNGFDAMDATLFENAYWILTPNKDSSVDESVINQVSPIIELTGSNLVFLDPEIHDEIMANLSHAPQLVASTLSASVPQKSIIDNNYLHFAGRGFRDTTRIAASSFNMWKDIFSSNQDEIIKAVKAFKENLDELYQALINLPSSENQLQEIFEKGIQNRSQLSQPGKSFNQGLSELIVQMDDQPGMILKIMKPLANAGINILDIELLKVREGVEGNLLLAFKSINDANRAAKILSKQGFESRLR